MEIKLWLKNTNRREREAVANAAGTNVAYLRQLASGYRVSSWKLAERLEQASKQLTPDKIISKQLLRSDIAGYFGGQFIDYK